LNLNLERNNIFMEDIKGIMGIMIPILAVGGLALGLLASRNSSTADEAPAE